MDPVRSSLDWKLDFLREVADFLLCWEKSGKPGLTKETFLALRQTCLSLADCAAYLLNNLDFKYVLLGRLQSDDIESRFGWLRQLSGANYFISMRQVMESNRKIKAISLLRFSSLSLAQIDEAIQSSTITGDNPAPASRDSSSTVADTIASNLTFNVIPTDADLSTVYYVGGAVARSAVRSTKCCHCKLELISSDEDPLDDSSIPSSSTDFFDNVNRGGLSKPTEYTYSLSVLCWRVFEEIKSSSSLSPMLLNSTVQRDEFLNVIDRLPDNSLYDCPQQTLDNYCLKGHDVKKLVVLRLFNCFAKNLVRSITTSACPRNASDQPSKRRKIAKLTGTTSQ